MIDINEIIKYTSKFNLLYIDDDEKARESALFLYEDIFKNIVFAEDGLDGIEKLKNNQIDLIITDIEMPNMNGLDMIEKIRCTDSDIPIVILSAHIRTDFFIRSIKLNIMGYLLKPINMESLLEILKNVISSISLKAEILEKLKLKEQLETSNTYLKSILDSVYDPIMVIKEDYSVELMNTTLRNNLSHYNIADIQNPKCYEISHNRTTPCDDINHPCPLKDVLQSKEPKSVVHDHFDKNNNRFYIELAATPLFDSKDNCIGIIESARDISAHVNAKNKLREQKDLLYHQAHHDVLTGLANRVLFDDRLQGAILRAKRSDKKVALFFIDLNKFKHINDSLGHKVGDAVLKAITIAMKKEMREEETIARIGGDEFTVIMENISDSKNAEVLAKKIINAIKRPVEIDGHTLNLSASIGISIYPDDAKDCDSILQYADMAMYEAKNNRQDILYFSKNLKEAGEC